MDQPYYCNANSKVDCLLCTTHVDQDHYDGGVYLGENTFVDKYCEAVCRRCMKHVDTYYCNSSCDNKGDRCRKLRVRDSTYCINHKPLSYLELRLEAERDQTISELVRLFPKFVDIDVSPVKAVSTQISKTNPLDGSMTPLEFRRHLQLVDPVTFVTALKKYHTDIDDNVDSLSIEETDVNPIILFSSWYVDVVLAGLYLKNDTRMTRTCMLKRIRTVSGNDMIPIYAVFGNIRVMGTTRFASMVSNPNTITTVDQIAKWQQDIFKSREHPKACTCVDCITHVDKRWDM